MVVLIYNRDSQQKKKEKIKKLEIFVQSEKDYYLNLFGLS